MSSTPGTLPSPISLPPHEAAMAKHLVCLTFDHDNTSGAISRELTTPTMLSRGDFGIVATARILELLRRDAIAPTWVIPGHTIESYPAFARAVARAGTRA